MEAIERDNERREQPEEAEQFSLQPFKIIETPINQQSQDVLFSLAWDEAACRKVGNGEMAPVARLWRHPRGFVLGMRDRRLPAAAAVIHRMRSSGTSVAVRNSGGAAVPLDAGVLNMSMIFPNQSGKVDFHKDFRLMARIIGEAVEQCSGVRTRQGEIRGAYCPGEYDLAVGNRKFCGIAQRRQLRAYMITAFIVVMGSGSERGRQARSFYEEALGEEAGTESPDSLVVLPETMASLQELTSITSMTSFTNALTKQLEQLGGEHIPSERSGKLISDDEVYAAADAMKQRYDRD